MSIDYDHTRNPHSTAGPRKALPELFRDGAPKTLLDVGCGTGTWLKAALENGVSEVVGVDGIAVPSEQLLVPANCVSIHDLTKSWRINRSFDAVLCLEVAEHLDHAYANVLIETLVNHSETVYFSAACPNQSGQHHVNCQWPAYWQQLFNSFGYTCSDEVRWRIWNMAEVEPWYRQNMFKACKDPKNAGNEPRIAPVIHPDMLYSFTAASEIEACQRQIHQIAAGSQPVSWYITTPFRGLPSKLGRFMERSKSDKK